MQRIFVLTSPVRIEESDEHGTRLIFVENALNPRDKLGKYGVALFGNYSDEYAAACIRVKASLLKKDTVDEKDENVVLNINRSSLCKYLDALDPAFDAQSKTHEELMKKLNDTTWTNANKAEGQNAQGDKKMRHAGEHNQRKLSGWFQNISDSIVGSFFSWLYKATLSSVTTFIARFLFIRKEKQYFEVSEVLAKERFKAAAEKQEIPSYQKHLAGFTVTDKTRFSDIPVLTKDNYVKPATDAPWQTLVGGKLPQSYKVDTSTGTTGNPTVWYRSAEEILTVKEGLITMGRLSLGAREVLTINAFALGPWATGLSVHELGRSSGSVFSPGANPEQIFAIIKNQHHFEQDQLDKALVEFKKQLKPIDHARANIDEELKTLANEILNDLVKDHELTVTMAVNLKINGLTNAHLKQYRSQFNAMITKLNAEKKQILLTGYPPFLLELAKYARDKKIDIKKYCITAMVGGQGLSEAMRKEMENEGFTRVMSSFGASDLDINIGMESDLEVTLRRALEDNPGMAREMYGANQGVPMVFRYDPLNYHIECDPTNNHLIMTCNRDNRASPRVRYDIQDQGRVYAASDVQAMLTKHGLFSPKLKMKHNLPFLFIWGRDSTAGFGKVNVPFDQLEKALLKVDTDKLIRKRALYSYEVDHVARFDIILELNDGVDFLNADQMKELQAKLIQEMANNNEYFADEIAKPGAVLPKIVFFKRGESPISEPGGVRKQVLIFKKGTIDETTFKCTSTLTNDAYEELIKPEPAPVLM